MNRDDIADFTIGIEEEYLLVDPETGELADEPTEEILAECAADFDDSVGFVVPEFLRAQVEVGTAVCHSVGEARSKLARLRRSVADAALYLVIKFIPPGQDAKGLCAQAYHVNDLL